MHNLPAVRCETTRVCVCVCLCLSCCMCTCVRSRSSICLFVSLRLVNICECLRVCLDGFSLLLSSDTHCQFIGVCVCGHVKGGAGRQRDALLHPHHARQGCGNAVLGNLRVTRVPGRWCPTRQWDVPVSGTRVELCQPSHTVFFFSSSKPKREHTSCIKHVCLQLSTISKVQPHPKCLQSTLMLNAEYFCLAFTTSKFERCTWV